MATQVVQMDYEVIQGVSDGFKAAQAAVQAVAAAMIAVVLGYAASALFTCPPLVTYYLQWAKLIQDKSKKLADKLEEISDDLKQAIGDHRGGDVAGKSYFMKGISSV